jgi:hypothetical protein
MVFILLWNPSLKQVTQVELYYEYGLSFRGGGGKRELRFSGFERLSSFEGIPLFLGARSVFFEQAVHFPESSFYKYT